MSDSKVYLQYIAWCIKNTYQKDKNEIINLIKKKGDDPKKIKNLALGMYSAFYASMTTCHYMSAYDLLNNISTTKLLSLVKDLNKFKEEIGVNFGVVHYTTKKEIFEHMKAMQASLGDIEEVNKITKVLPASKITKTIKKKESKEKKKTQPKKSTEKDKKPSLSKTKKSSILKKKKESDVPLVKTKPKTSPKPSSKTKRSPSKSVSKSFSKREDLKKKTVIELKKIASNEGRKGYSSLKKEQLIDFLLAPSSQTVKPKEKSIKTSKSLKSSKVSRFEVMKSKPSQKPKEIKNKSISPPQNRIIGKVGDCLSRSKVKLRPYQERPIKFLLENRGVILSFGTGTGKTLTAVAGAECVLSQNPDWLVIVITPTSLETNFRIAMEQYGIHRLDNKYLFYTPATFHNILNFPKINSNKKAKKDRNEDQETRDKEMMLSHKNLVNLINSGKFIIIVDEAHTFKRNLHPSTSFGKSPEGTRAEDLIKTSKKAGKVMLLTATALYNGLVDIVNLMAMIKGEDELSEDQFNRLIGYDPKMNDRELSDFKLKLDINEKAKRYFECVFDFHEKNADDPNYPKVKYHTIPVVMTPSFYIKYREEESKQPRKRGEKEGVSKAFYNNLRDASVKYTPNLKAEWVVNKIREGEKTLVYSAYRDWGINKIKTLLGKNYKSETIEGKIPKDKRQTIVDEFNDPKGDTNLLFITKAGGEGLDLKGVKNIIIFERNWNKGIEEQVIGRGVRSGSHLHLPEAQRIVNIYFIDLKKPSYIERQKAISLYNKSHKNKLTIEKDHEDMLTVDEIMKEKGELKEKKIKIFINWLKSIDISSERCKNRKINRMSPIKANLPSWVGK